MVMPVMSRQVWNQRLDRTALAHWHALPTLLTAKWWAPIAIRWTGAAAAGDTTIVADGQGRELWQSVALGAEAMDQTYVAGAEPVEGLIVSVLDSGISWSLVYGAWGGAAQLGFNLAKLKNSAR
jgi:hypothetical protein